MQVGSLRRIGKDGQTHTTIYNLNFWKGKSLGQGQQETQRKKVLITYKDDINFFPY